MFTVEIYSFQALLTTKWGLNFGVY